MYIDRLMNAGEALDWAICGVGVMPSDRDMRDVMSAQGCRYTLVEKHPSGIRRPRVIGSISEYLFAPDDPERVIDRLCDEAVRVVSLTITEGGYSIDDLTGEFDPRTPDVARDLARHVPATVFGLIVSAIQRRRDAGLAPFTIMSCDNLPGNGNIARRAFTGFARMLEPALADWMDHEMCFPNSMVDRMVPGTTNLDRQELRAEFGIDDQWPVVCEPFVQWVLEDSFSAGRPPYENAGVQMVTAAEPYELIKLRMLNGSHQALAYLGRLCDYEFVNEAATAELFQAFLRGYMDREVTPTLSPVPDLDLRSYKDQVIERFSNGEIRDPVARICAESSDRIPKFVLPVIRAQLDRDGDFGRAAAIIASWARYAEGVDEHGRPIEVVDRQRTSLMSLASRQRHEPRAFLANREIFGDLIENERFVGDYLWALRSLHKDGARATMSAVVARYQ